MWTVTGMDVHPQGNGVALQTYAGPYEDKLSSPFDMASLSAATPMGGMSDKGAEAIAYSLDGMWQIPEDIGCQTIQPLMRTYTATSSP